MCNKQSKIEDYSAVITTVQCFSNKREDRQWDAGLYTMAKTSGLTPVQRHTDYTSSSISQDVVLDRLSTQI